MEKCKIFAFFLLSTLVLPIALFTIPEVHAISVGDYFTCKFVDSTGRWEKKTDQFETTDIAVYVWVELEDLEIGTDYQVAWIWRNPNNEEYDYTEFAFTAIGNTEKVWAWMYIQGRAPEKQPGEWNCEFYYRWWGGGWTFGFKVPFTIGKLAPSTYPVTITSNVAEASITVDGMTSGGGVFNWEKDSTHSVAVKEVVPGKEGVRYVFESWSDGNTAPSRTITVAGPMTYTANYKTQYYLTITSEHGNVEGEEWYDEGSKAYAVLDEGKVDAGWPYEYVFKEWSGDASGKRLKSDAIKMDGPKEAIAIWEKQFSMTFYVVIVVVVVAVLAVAAISLRIRKRAKKPAEKPLPPTTYSCHNCGAQVKPEDVFCPNCGKPLIKPGIPREGSPSGSQI